MKQIIEVKQNAEYGGQDMSWTETIEGKVMLKKGDKLWHFSSGKIEAFYPKETCFFGNHIKGLMAIYILLKLIKIWKLIHMVENAELNCHLK